MASPRTAIALALYYGVASRLPRQLSPGGELSRRVRGWCCKRIFEHAGDWINVEPDVYIGLGARIRLGEGSAFGRSCRIYGGVDVRDRVMIGPEVVFLSRNHSIADRSLPIGEQGDEPQRVPVVEELAWIGTRAIILPGRRIGRGAVVGAGAVVTHDVEPFAIVGGNPARVLGYRPEAAPVLDVA